jgi:uncharacterized membrane protein YqiK
MNEDQSMTPLRMMISAIIVVCFCALVWLFILKRSAPPPPPVVKMKPVASSARTR